MTTIEWTDETWNPVVGCSRVSAGCDHCYAMGVAHRGMSPQHRGLTKLRPRDAWRPGVDWTGEVRTVPEMLAKPLHWRKPRRVFVNSMSDLFHHRVPFEFIAAVFGVMAATPHTYQVLTKRPERAREFFAWVLPRNPPAFGSSAAVVNELWARAHGFGIEHNDIARRFSGAMRWPLPNVHLGVSVEDQATANERITVLLDCPAALHWASYEPALGPVDFVEAAVEKRLLRSSGRLRWVVVGGESGPGARPFDLAWARKTVADCRAAGVPVFVKQLGARPFIRNPDYRNDPDDRGDLRDVMLTDRKGGDWNEWPADLRVREVPA